MSEIPATFLSACEEQDLHPSPAQLTLLRSYVDQLLEVNQHMNLTAVRDAEGVWMRHIFDSLLLVPDLKADLNQRALDLGSGGGFPGIPLAILRPDIQWTLVDSVAKKVRFLNELAQNLELSNVRAVSERAEVLGWDPDHRECYHLVTARAVARLPVLLELTIPFLRVNGLFAAMKGEQAAKELKESRRAIERLSVKLLRSQAQPGGGHLLWFKKRRPTHTAYPRAVGIPAQKPL
ncbi:MAG: 16S rRNA (guanine(527)-N(7))-methyltransferase RsmG [Kiritimatiellae bacterium]|jgi:16S rRNA (guanine527-N7)-methyltransferase|nr:16S rRNA (guanine(527)-N(7))-methyltransferase RsmG [Kiritimatiellia bacterium]